MIEDKDIANYAPAQRAEEPPLHWMYPLDPEARNVDVLPDIFNAEGGCDECKGAFIEIDAFGVEAPPTLATEVLVDGSLQVASEHPMPVSAVRLECSLGHLTVVRRSAWSALGMVGLISALAVVGAGMLVVARGLAR